MSGNADGNTITLSGDWSMNGVADQMPYLLEQLALFPELSSSQEKQPGVVQGQPKIIIEIDELDASGCQLLTLFVLMMERKGFMPLLTNLTDAVKEKIQYLGFGRQLGAHFEAPLECL